MRKEKAARESKTAKIKRRRLKYIFVLPSAVTLLNSLFGFMSLVYASRGPEIFLQVSRFRPLGMTCFAAAGYMIIFAMIADMLDGQVARWSGSSSSFGGQLDSLSDAISFGVAPAFLMLKIMNANFGVEDFAQHIQFPAGFQWAFPGGSLWLVNLSGNVFIFTAIVYALCAVIRLARFNVENDEDISAHLNFAGLPSPAAAGVVVSLVIFREDFLPRIADRLPGLFSTLMTVTIWLLPPAVFASGILMVTRVRYPHAVNKLLRRKKTFFTFVLLLFAGLLAAWNIQIAMLLGFWGFAVVGVIRYFLNRFFRRQAASQAGPRAVPPQIPPDAPSGQSKAL